MLWKNLTVNVYEIKNLTVTEYILKNLTWKWCSNCKVSKQLFLQYISYRELPQPCIPIKSMSFLLVSLITPFPTQRDHEIGNVLSKSWF